MAGPSHDPSLYQHRDVVPIRRALLSVSDKTALTELAAALSAAGVEMVSTGSTAQTIRDAGFSVTDVADVTGFAECLDGRVKTLHPSIHAGILADLRLEDHQRQLEALHIDAFQLVVVNLYPFKQTVAAGAPPADIVENIDIGGPAMVRAAAKNHANVAIVVDPKRYDAVIAALPAGGTTFALRQQLAAEAFSHTADYDGAVSQWFASQLASTQAKPQTSTTFESSVEITGTLAQTLRYGENAHQAAALYTSPGGSGIAQATLLHGKEMSYNNFVDADAALRAAYDFTQPAVAIIKHANPCGIAVAAAHAEDPIADAHRRAHDCDPVSAFGGVIAANREVSLGMAETIADIFTEVIVAPSFAPEALAVLTEKKNIRLLQLPTHYARDARELRQISGGWLSQEPDVFDHLDSSSWQLVAGDAANAATLADLEFAWRACRSVKSNAILLAHNGASVGVGMGQVNRVDSCHLAVSRAGDRSTGSVAASDAFFPFADGLQVLLEAGVRAVVQPGGSIRDEEVIAAAASAGVTMYFTGERHFFH